MKRLIIIIFLLAFGFVGVPLVHALSTTVHVPEKYTEVEAGERLYFEIDIKYPENPRRKDLRLQYKITKDGETIAQAKVLKAVETQASFIDFIVIPESAKKGLHIITISISDYEVLDEEVLASFHVIGSRVKQITLYFFILLGVILLVALLVVIDIFFIKRRRRV